MFHYVVPQLKRYKILKLLLWAYRASCGYFIVAQLSLLSLSSCSSYDSEKYSKILRSIPVTDLSCGFSGTELDLTLSRLADSVRYVALPIDVGRPMSVVKNVAVIPTMIVVSDDHHNLICFDHSGNLLWSIYDIHGKGPGEFIEVSRLDISAALNLLVVYDDMQANTSLYQLTTGSFISNFRSNLYPFHIKILDNDELLFYINRPQYWEHMHALWILSFNGQVKKKLWQRYDKLDMGSNIGFLPAKVSPCFGGWCIFECFSFGLVKFDPVKYSLKPVLRYDFTNSFAYPMNYDFNRNEVHKQMMMSGHSIGGVSILNGYYIFWGRKNMQRIYFALDQETGACGRLASKGIEDDISMGPDFYPLDYSENNLAWDIVEKEDIDGSVEFEDISMGQEVHCEILRIVYLKSKNNH